MAFSGITCPKKTETINARNTDEFIDFNSKPMSEIKMNLNDVTAGEISAIFNKMKNSGSIFNMDFAQISKHLLKEFLPVNPFKVGYDELIKSYLNHIDFHKEETFQDLSVIKKEGLLEAIKFESTFHQHICKTFFDLVKLPKDELLEEYGKTINDLKIVERTLNDIKNELQEITNRNNSTEIQKEKPILYYYQKHNEEAKNSILSFLINDIKGYCLNNCYDKSLWGSMLMWNVPYNYRWNPRSYEPKPPNDLANKFRELPINMFSEIDRDYKENKPKFSSFLNDYINNEEIVFSINNLIQYNHLLNSRKEILIETLNIYVNGSKIMFATAVPSIIEGLFHDLCILFGEKEEELLSQGFQFKLDKLHKYLDVDLYYEYYSFRFRLFRNKVSHGRLTKEDVDEMADLLLLDLYHVCKLLFTDKLDLNHKRFVIDELSKNLSKPDFKYLMKYILLEHIAVPNFYELDKKMEEIESLIKGENFWNFLGDEISNGGNAAVHGIHFLVKKIKKMDIEVEKCTEILKKVKLSKSDSKIAGEYFKYLTRDIYS